MSETKNTIDRNWALHVGVFAALGGAGAAGSESEGSIVLEVEHSWKSKPFVFSLGYGIQHTSGSREEHRFTPNPYTMNSPFLAKLAAHYRLGHDFFAGLVLREGYGSTRINRMHHRGNVIELGGSLACFWPPRNQEGLLFTVEVGISQHPAQLSSVLFYQKLGAGFEFY